MSKTVLLTGANGFIGTHVARHVTAQTDHLLIAVVRAPDLEAARRRLKRAWWPWPELHQLVDNRITVLVGDVREPKLGLEAQAFTQLVGELGYIIHAAADLRLNGPLEQMRATNVKGTEHCLELARTAHEDHGIERFTFISTAYVAGRRGGSIPEEPCSQEVDFENTYEQTKCEAERCVATAAETLPVTVLRPGMVVGETVTGAISVFNTLYYPLSLYLSGKLAVFPTSPSMRVVFVPVDYVAEAITRLTLDSHAEGKTFHLVAPPEASPSARELMAFVREWAETHLDSHLPRVLFVPLPSALVRGVCRLLSGLGVGPRRVAENMSKLAPYFAESKQFVRTNTDELLGEYGLNWGEFLPALLDFATYHGFLHRTPRTVHEQIIKRLTRKHQRIVFHDVKQKSICTYTGSDIRDEMLAAACSLRALGVMPGDRVAVVSTNSSRYLAVDVAIGLVGAVSVPLYVTSPPEEIHRIVTQSETRLLFIGDASTLKRLAELHLDMPMVQLHDEMGLGELPCVLAWSSFLARGAGAPAQREASVGFEDTATIRYSSGTTGDPRGAVFTHGQLRWMAETIAALPSWQARNKPISYVSFLPMNHVVEGILALYSPYYAPASVDIWFVENLGRLPEALKRAQPTVFFAVPRVFEKLYDHFRRSRLGRCYRTMHDTRARTVARALVRALFLRRAGLNRCGLFIVGSASVSSELLQGFRDIGIEIHNAYGLTEAPLVTINRLGANRIGTVGEPLRETRVRVDGNGSVFVQGPQVATGYHGEVEGLHKIDGWLPTGDLGVLTDEGSLVLAGRADNMIVTSYGKSIHPEPVEALIKKIRGVDEAMLVGDGRPFCAAILWVSWHRWSHFLDHDVDRGMRDLERHLPGPLHPKRWAVVRNDLAIETGELTPNYKLRRRTVLARYAQVIAALYQEGSVPDTVLSMGEADRSE